MTSVVKEQDFKLKMVNKNNHEEINSNPVLLEKIYIKIFFNIVCFDIKCWRH